MFTFIQREILGMKWLSVVFGDLLAAVGLDLNGPVGGSIHFFLYDVSKITILLCVLIFFDFLYTKFFSA